MQRIVGSGITSLAHYLGIFETELRCARSQARYLYVQKSRLDNKSGKIRDLCYPPPMCVLTGVQRRVKEVILDQLDLLPEVRGYRRDSDNIRAAKLACGARYQGKVDISKYHPSITAGHVSQALSAHGLSPSWARIVAQLVTFKGTVPQGACTSNSIGNLVMDGMLRRFVKEFAKYRGVGFLNYGDDIAFFGSDERRVRACVRQAKRAVKHLGFQVNEKCESCQDRSAGRLFLGCETGRRSPNYPRSRYRDFRKELRGLIRIERSRQSPKPSTTKKELDSIAQRIRYVKRLSVKKAKALRKLVFTLCDARREIP